MIEARGPHVTALRPPMPGRDVDWLDDATGTDAPEVVRDLAAALQAYLAGERVELASRAQVEEWLDAAGVAGFRRDLSLALFDVPRGVTLAYGELAALAGRPGAARAAGTTCARNPLPIIVPCHRVVGANGHLTGFGGGIETKAWLLDHEQNVRNREA